MPKSGYGNSRSNSRSTSHQQQQQQQHQQQQQRQRSKAGARVLRSKKVAEQDKLRRLDQQLAKASDLEAQLGALLGKGDRKTQGEGDYSNNNNNSNKSYKLRSHLCEVLSDVLISDPRLSLEKDCFQRLWRGCFYNPIRVWRQQVSREKRKRSPRLASTKEGFQHFLSEAVILYEYLILQYLSMLCPPPNTQQRDADEETDATTGDADNITVTQQSRDTTGTTVCDRSQLEDTQYASQSTAATTAATTTTTTTTKPTEGVVQGLYKLYIFMGDLHRYAEAYNKAERNYANASKLGPGLGNPYNQLAVVAFSRETYCVALYWYARSILATHERFSTSSNNLERLFASNRDFLAEHGRDSGTPMVFGGGGGGATAAATAALPDGGNKSGGKNHHRNNSSNNNNNNSNNHNHNMQRALKMAASKSCLTHFVDLHYDLYLLQQRQQQQQKQQPSLPSSTMDLNNGDDDEQQQQQLLLKDKIKNVVASFRSLVQASGFGDSLLCKIVVINSFTLERASDGGGAGAGTVGNNDDDDDDDGAANNANNNDSSNDSSNSPTQKLAEELWYSLGLVLVEHSEGFLAKALEKATTIQTATKKAKATTTTAAAAPSVRWLLPLEIMLEFCNLRSDKRKSTRKSKSKRTNDYSSNADCDADADADPTPVEIRFWKGVAKVANLARDVVKAYNIRIIAQDGATSTSTSGAIPHWAQIKEYQILKGYRPFSIVNEEYGYASNNKDGFVTATEAVNVLELSTTTQTQTQTQQLSQDTGGATATSSNNNNESRARLLRMVEICDQLASSSSGAPLTVTVENEKEVYNYYNATAPPPSLGIGDDDETETPGKVDSNLTLDEDENGMESQEQEGGHGFAGDDDYSDSDDEAGDDVVLCSSNNDNNDGTVTRETENSDASSAPVAHAKPVAVADPIEPTDDVVMSVAEKEERGSNPVVTAVPATMIKPPPGFGGSSPATPTAIDGESSLVMNHNHNHNHNHNNHLSAMTASNPATCPGLPLSSPTGRGMLDHVIGSPSFLFQSPPPQHQHQHQHQQPPLDAHMQMQMPGLSTTNYSHHRHHHHHQNDPSLYSLPNGSVRSDPNSNSNHHRHHLPTSLEESVRIFGDIQTANPFVMQPPAAGFLISSDYTNANTNAIEITPHHNPIVHNNNNNNNNNGHQFPIPNEMMIASVIPDFVVPETHSNTAGSAEDTTKWLNSNLLNSLWMDETSKTNNPWASE